MKSVMNDCSEKKNEKPFPKLMKVKASDVIYLMTTPTSGTKVYVGYGMYPLGKAVVRLHISELEDFNGTVTLGECE